MAKAQNKGRKYDAVLISADIPSNATLRQKERHSSLVIAFSVFLHQERMGSVEDGWWFVKASKQKAAKKRLTKMLKNFRLINCCKIRLKGKGYRFSFNFNNDHLQWWHPGKYPYKY